MPIVDAVKGDMTLQSMRFILQRFHSCRIFAPCTIEQYGAIMLGANSAATFVGVSFRNFFGGQRRGDLLLNSATSTLVAFSRIMV